MISITQASAAKSNDAALLQNILKLFVAHSLHPDGKTPERIKTLLNPSKITR
ncbi:MAG: hypothetical protein U1A24_07315 [Cypionkella sp.]|uniref:hypothetical protein n=1 Tax=Cypionkella sp. TaxID=2811411 RepID=UPI002ABA5DEF|nr:hypothetical protein [Cypionkella sp.]MDZ4310349.1 hypothetical protein [Cypionkella sp.]MDZ4395527.1 hypothetical protein [Cypionkella sp.]